jgi:hypothetical protein
VNLYHVVVYDNAGKPFTVVSGRSKDFVVSKFITQAIARVKKEKLSIDRWAERTTFLIIDDKNRLYGEIMGASDGDEHPGGIFAVQLYDRNVLHAYDIRGKMVSTSLTRRR